MFNGKVPEAVTYNGNDAQIVKCNGVVVWEKNKKLRQLAVGSVVYLMEDNYTPYIIIAHGHHGGGLTTLLRQNVNKYCRFHFDVPTDEYYNKYDESTLKTEMGKLFSNLPAETQRCIETVYIPVRNSAQDSTSISIPVNFFPLSGYELNGSGSAGEGTQIQYFKSDALRVATDGTTALVYWTRSVVPGMHNFARCVDVRGELGNYTVNVNIHMRPACCVASDFVVTETDGKYYVI